MQIPFKATPKKVGNSYMVVVPKDYFNNGILSETKEYKFVIEVEEKKGDGDGFTEEVSEKR